MAHKKAGGYSRNGRDSNPKMLGVKLFGPKKEKPEQVHMPARRPATEP